MAECEENVKMKDGIVKCGEKNVFLRIEMLKNGFYSPLSLTWIR